MKKVEKFSKLQISPKSFPKLSKCVLKMFCGNFFENFLSPVFHRGSRLRKFSKKFTKGQTSKNVNNRFQKCPKMFWGDFIPNNFMPSAPWNVEFSKIFKKIKKFSNFQKYPKSFPKKIQTCLERVLGQIFRDILCPVFHGGSSFRKLSKKIKKISKFQKCPKSFPKVSKRVLNKFWG